jgi:hypothetical protein
MMFKRKCGGLIITRLFHARGQPNWILATISRQSMTNDSPSKGHPILSAVAIKACSAHCRHSSSLPGQDTVWLVVVFKERLCAPLDETELSIYRQCTNRETSTNQRHIRSVFFNPILYELKSLPGCFLAAGELLPVKGKSIYGFFTASLANNDGEECPRGFVRDGYSREPDVVSFVTGVHCSPPII